MKLQKMVDKENGIDTYTVRFSHEEATAAFKMMSNDERRQIHDLQRENKISSILRTLSMWAEKVEYAKRTYGWKRGRSETQYDG